MKRVFLRSRYTIFATSLVLAFLYSLYRVGPPPTGGYTPAPEGSGLRSRAIRENLGNYLSARYDLEISPEGVVLAPRFGIPEGYGYSVIAWFTGRAVGDASTELYSVTAFMSQKGIPLSVNRPLNVSQTPDVDERILDAEASRVLFWTRQAQGKAVITMLAFNERESMTTAEDHDTFLHKLEALQRYGQWRLPWRVELGTHSQISEVKARLFGDQIEGQVDDHSFSYNLRTGRLSGNAKLVLVQGGVGEADSLSTGLDYLRGSTLFGGGRMNAFLDTYAGLNRWIRHGLGENQQFSFLPPQLPDALEKTEENWPPRIPQGDSGGLEWVEADICQSRDCPVVRLEASDKTRLGGVTVMALDSRRLGLDYRVGRKYPRSSTGLVGGLPMSESQKKNGLLAIPVTNRQSRRGLGSIANGRILVPPQEGRPTLMINGLGQIAFGPYAEGTFTDSWLSLWQGYEPLVEGGLIVQSTVERGGDQFGRSAESEVFRSAIGMSSEGHVLYAFGAEKTAEDLAKALVQANAIFAIPVLDHDPGNPLVDLGKAWKDGVINKGDGERGMPTVSDALEYFWIYRTQRLPRQVSLKFDPLEQPKKLSFEPFYSSGCYELVAKLVIPKTLVDGDRNVVVYAVDALQVRAHLLPGLAEPRPMDSEKLDSLRLPSEPLFSMSVGLRNARSPYGMIFERRIWQQPKRGVLSLVADGRGSIRFGAYGSMEVPDAVRWYTLIQGPSLLDDGKSTVHATGWQTGAPMVAVSMSENIVYFFVSDDGDVQALAKSAKALGLSELMQLGERGSTDTGLVDRFFGTVGNLSVLKQGETQLRRFRPSRSFDTSLLFTGRIAPPQAKMLGGSELP